MKRSELKNMAKKSMKNNYGTAILYMILFNLLLIGSVSIGLFLGLVLVAGAISCSRIAFYMDMAKNKPSNFDSTFRGFKFFGRAIATTILLMLISGIFVVAIMIMPIVSVFVGVSTQTATTFAATAEGGSSIVSLILVIVSFVVALIVGLVGLVVYIKLSFTFYVMVDRPDLSAGQCISQSWKITKKRFFKILGFHLSYIGWWILTAWTLGLLYLYVKPYYRTALCNLYFELAEDLGPVATTAASLDASTVAGYLAQ